MKRTYLGIILIIIVLLVEVLRPDLLPTTANTIASGNIDAHGILLVIAIPAGIWLTVPRKEEFNK